MHPIDIAIVGIYVAYALYTGFHSKSESSKSLEEYFLAGRSLKGWQSGLSMAAAQFAADTPLLVTGLVATAGIFALWRLWVYAFAFLLLGFLLGPSWRRAGVITDAELTEVRYGQGPAMWLRGFKAIYLGTIFNCTVLAMVLLAATRIAEPFLFWNVWLPESVFQPVVQFVQWINFPLTLHTTDPNVWVYSASNLISILLISTVTTFYSATGGLRNVVKMDIFQFLVKMLGTAAYAIVVIIAIGGLQEIPAKLHTLFAVSDASWLTPAQILAFTPGEAKDVTFLMITLFGIQWIAQMNADGSGYLAQRTMACRSDKDAKQAAVVFTVVQVILRTLLWIPIALGLLVLFPPDFSLSGEMFQATREATYVSGMVELLPVGVKGLMITAMIAALGSTVDTHVNWGASYWTNDIFKRIICEAWLKKEPPGWALVWVARCSSVAILFLGLFIMTKLGSIGEAWKASLLLGAGLGIVLVLRWLWWRMNAWGELASILTSLVMAPLMLNPQFLAMLPWFTGLNADGQDALRLITLAVVSTTISIVVALLVGPESMLVLQNFYKKAHPPGFWGPVAESVGENPAVPMKRMTRAFGAIATAAVSVFAILMGVGSWMVQSPPPGFLPSQPLWIGLLLVVGFGMIPVWYNLAFKGPQLPDVLSEQQKQIIPPDPGAEPQPA
ncbi:MAG: hypothetical protein VKJ04_00085 [Vampirovibrionales bacterium]|nr:hypothetical protein [Vampirovibrionales bacterium]